MTGKDIFLLLTVGAGAWWVLKGREKPPRAIGIVEMPIKTHPPIVDKTRPPKRGGKFLTGEERAQTPTSPDIQKGATETQRASVLEMTSKVKTAPKKTAPIEKAVTDSLCYYGITPYPPVLSTMEAYYWDRVIGLAQARLLNFYPDVPRSREAIMAELNRRGYFKQEEPAPPPPSPRPPSYEEPEAPPPGTPPSGAIHKGLIYGK